MVGVGILSSTLSVNKATGVLTSISNRKYFLTVQHNGNVTLEDIYNVARIMRERSMARFFSGTVKV